MGIVSFRPHKMRIITKGEGSYDENGDWNASAASYSDYIVCRYEPNGSANTITLPDGKEYRYSYTIYLNVNPSLVIRYGDILELTSQDGVVIGSNFEVKGFHRGQLDMKVWV